MEMTTEAGPDLLTNSRMKAARSCARLHQLRYVEGWQSVQEARALHFGTLIHRGLEAWWLASEDRLDAALAAIQGETNPFDLVKAEELLRGYHFRWIDAPFEVLAVEQPFAAELRNPQTGAPSRTWRLAGKIDAIVRDAGRTLLVEHKTSSEDIGPGSAYWKRLRMDGQISVYYRGAESLGYDVQGCLYDVIGKPSIKPLKATPVDSRKYTKEGRLYAAQRDQDETPEQYRMRLREDIANNPESYYQRGPVVRLENEMADAMLDIWQTGRTIRENAVAGRAPRNPDACFQYHRPCQFFEVCSGAESLQNPAAFKRLPIVHPELDGVFNAQPTLTKEVQP